MKKNKTEKHTVKVTSNAVLNEVGGAVYLTPKRKAKELVKLFVEDVMYDHRGDEEPIFSCQRHCAIILVDEVIKVLSGNDIFNAHTIKYWQNVRVAIYRLQR